MARDGVRDYLAMALGVGDATRARAMEVAQSMIELASKAAPGELATASSALAEDLISSARANREMVLELIRAEVMAVIESSAHVVRLGDLEGLSSRPSRRTGGPGRPRAPYPHAPIQPGTNPSLPGDDERQTPGRTNALGAAPPPERRRGPRINGCRT